MKFKPPAPHCLSRQRPELASRGAPAKGPLNARSEGPAPSTQTPPRKHL